jgi:uncharacterized membrane protein
MDMLPFLVPCVAPLLIYLLWTRGAGPDRGRFAHMGLGFAFFLFALGHFAITQEMVDMLPPWLPMRPGVVYATGVAEVAVALALITQRWRVVGAIAAAMLLIGFFPVNVYAAYHHVGGEMEQRLGLAYLWVRAPVQAFFVAWALWPLLRRV